MKSVTILIPSYRRPDNIPILIKRIKEFTYPIERVMIWNNNCTEDGKDIHIKDDELKIDIINSNTNRFETIAFIMLGHLTKSDYILAIDDDRPPGPKFVEWAIKKQEETQGWYVQRGVRLSSKKSYLPNTRISSKVRNGELELVDFGGGVSFYPNSYTQHFLREKPPTYVAISDMHFAYTIQKYGNCKVYTPHPPEEGMLPMYKKEIMPNKDDDATASWRRQEHWINRTGYVRWATRNGWKLIEAK